MPREILLVLGDQLFAEVPNHLVEHPRWMMEDWGLATRVRHHKQKLILFFSAMRHYASSCPSEVFYQRLGASGGLLHHLVDFCRRQGVRTVHGFEIADRFYAQAVEEALLAARIEWVPTPSPMFLTGREDWLAYRHRSRRLKMADFYTVQRRRLNLLMAGDQPLGGQWSYDEHNRKKLPRGFPVPPVGWIPPDEMTMEVMAMVEAAFPSHPGTTTGFGWPVTHHDSTKWLDSFLAERFCSFGPFEDALSQRSDTLFHSLLAPMLNTGLLTPKRVVQKAMDSFRSGEIPLASAEGFIRQIIGWREFIRWVDTEYNDPAINFFGHSAKLAPCWWSGETGIPPLDDAIAKANQRGWLHHIERLMVVGSLMLLCRVDPQEAYRWFMEMFVDSADWVMAPNVLGMSQFADGGLFSTKPYFCGSAYILKMSDYGRGPWCDIWDGLYWSFVHDHRSKLSSNHRLGAMLGTLDKMSADRKSYLFRLAYEFRNRVTIPAGVAS